MSVSTSFVIAVLVVFFMAPSQTSLALRARAEVANATESDTGQPKAVVKLKCSVLDDGGRRDKTEFCKSKVFIIAVPLSNRKDFAEGKIISEDAGKSEPLPSEKEELASCRNLKKVDSCGEAMLEHGAGPRTCADFCVDSFRGTYPCAWERQSVSHACQAGWKFGIKQCSDTCGSGPHSPPSKSASIDDDLRVLWQTCREAKVHGRGDACCAQGQTCAARVLSVFSPPESLEDVDETDSKLSVDKLGMHMPREGAAKLMPFVFDARYHGHRFVFSPASRFDPREAPVVRACVSWISRVRDLILRHRLPLLMGWDARGFFDVFRRFDRSKAYGSSVKAAILSVLLNEQVVDSGTADEIWERWIEDGHTLHDGSDRVTWSEKLDIMLAETHNSLRQLENDITMLQHAEMGRGVKARNKDVKIRKVGNACVVALGGVALVALTGGLAAPAIGAGLGVAVSSVAEAIGFASSATNMAWVGGMRIGVTVAKHNNANEKKIAADRFGQTHKQLTWIRYQREWIEQFMEPDLRNAFNNPRPRLKVKKAVEEALICKFNGSSSPSMDIDDISERGCVFEGDDAREQLKATLLASWINVVALDGGCAAPPDLTSVFKHSPGTAFGYSGTPNVACCAQMQVLPGKLANTSKEMCAVHVASSGSGSICPSDWHQVAPEWAFADPNVLWQTDRSTRGVPMPLESKTCCGVFGTLPTTEFPCGVPDCVADYAWEPTSERLMEIETRLGNCTGSEWLLEDEVRKNYCAQKRSNPGSCHEALAFARCNQNRRAFCSFYATRKHYNDFTMYERKLVASVRSCLQDLASLSIHPVKLPEYLGRWS